MSISLLNVVVFYVLAPLALLAIGILLIVRSRRRGRPYPSCGRCGYDMTGSIGSVDRCPECGAAVAAAGITPAGLVRRSTGLLVTGILLVAISTGCLGCGGISLLGLVTANSARTRAVQAQRQAAQQAQQAAATRPATDAADEDEAPAGNDAEPAPE